MSLNNSRLIGIALVDFEADYGSFPDASTIPAVQLAAKPPFSLGTGSSNQLFRQLLATGFKGTAILGAGQPDLLDPSFPVWKGVAPDLKLQE